VVEEVKPQPEVVHAEEVVATPPAKEQPVEESLDVSGLVSKVKANPRDLNANLGLGDAYFSQRNYKQALDYYAMSVKLADKNSLESIVEKLQDMVASPQAEPRFHRVLGDAYMKQGHYHWALGEYSKALTKK
jgi:tetratricopeptide (TPR) repeat protein